jgi:hypothetical protein
VKPDHAIVHKQTDSGASALQAACEEGLQVVDLKNIRVAIYPSGRSWIAQGFEIDYVAQGKDVEDVKKAFENGLEATINQHIKVHGHIKNLLHFAPVDVRLEVLDRVFKNPEAMTPTYSQLSVHNCPPVKIEFLALSAAA